MFMLLLINLDIARKVLTNLQKFEKRHKTNEVLLTIETEYVKNHYKSRTIEIG